MFPAVANFSGMYLWCGANVCSLIGLNAGINQQDVPQNEQHKIHVTLTESEARRLHQAFPEIHVTGPGADRLRGE